MFRKYAYALSVKYCLQANKLQIRGMRRWETWRQNSANMRYSETIGLLQSSLGG